MSIAFVLTLVLVAAPVLAQDGESTVVDESQTSLPAATNVSARLIMQEADLTVGDPARLELEVTHPAGYQVFVPELNGAWGELEVLDQLAKTTEANGDGTETTRQAIDATLFATGEFWTPALALTLSDPAGNLSQAMVDPVPLQVLTVLTGEETEIEGIKPQASLPIPTTWPLLLLAGLAVLAVIGGVAWWIVRRLRRRSAVDNRMPEQVANDELERVRDLRLPEQGEFKEQYAQVTVCLWNYIEQQYHVPAVDLTTSELKRTLRATPMSEGYAQSFIELFTDCDLVKFAEFNPSVDAANQLIEQARQLVDLTAVEVAQQAAEEKKRANGANPPSATTTISSSVAGPDWRK